MCLPSLLSSGALQPVSVPCDTSKCRIPKKKKRNITELFPAFFPWLSNPPFTIFFQETHHFPMVFLWFSYGFPMVFCGLDCGPPTHGVSHRPRGKPDRNRPIPTAPSRPFSGPRGEPVPAPPSAVAAPTSAVPDRRPWPKKHVTGENVPVYIDN